MIKTVIFCFKKDLFEEKSKKSENKTGDTFEIKKDENEGINKEIALKSPFVASRRLSTLRFASREKIKINLFIFYYF